MIEVYESREMLDSGLGVIAGTAFVDANGNQQLDASEAYLPGATIQLYQTGSTTPLASQTTDAQGAYSFTGLAPGHYTVLETPPANYAVTGTQALSQVEPASTAPGNKIQVTVPSSPLWLNYNGVLPGSFQVANVQVYTTPEVDSLGPLRVSAGSAQGQSDVNAGFLTDCLNDLQRLTFAGGEQFRVNPVAVTQLTNGAGTVSADRAGRIAFLFNHFGNASLTNIQAPALQLAIWELLYDTAPTPDFSAGFFKVAGPVAPFTDQATLDQVIAQATTYFNESAGKSESAVVLDATPFLPPGQTSGAQTVIAQGSFNFANQGKPAPAVSSLSGLVYCDGNNDGTYDRGDMTVAGAVVTLTGTDLNGKTVQLAQTTDSSGTYGFTNLNPGTYTLTLYNAPLGYVPAVDNQGTPGTGATQTNRFFQIGLGAGVNGQNNNFGLKPQAVNATGLSLLGIHQQPSQIVLRFNGPLNAAAAENTANYSLVGLGKDEVLGTTDDVVYSLTSARYDPASGTVTLLPSRHLNIHYHYVLRMSLANAVDCGAPVTLTSVFGRTSVPFFDVHGALQPNPPLTAADARHNAAVIQQTYAKLNTNPNLV